MEDLDNIKRILQNKDISFAINASNEAFVNRHYWTEKRVNRLLGENGSFDNTFHIPIIPSQFSSKDSKDVFGLKSSCNYVVPDYYHEYLDDMRPGLRDCLERWFSTEWMREDLPREFWNSDDGKTLIYLCGLCFFIPTLCQPCVQSRTVVRKLSASYSCLFDSLNYQILKPYSACLHLGPDITSLQSPSQPFEQAPILPLRGLNGLSGDFIGGTMCLILSISRTSNHEVFPIPFPISSTPENMYIKVPNLDPDSIEYREDENKMVLLTKSHFQRDFRNENWENKVFLFFMPLSNCPHLINGLVSEYELWGIPDLSETRLSEEDVLMVLEELNHFQFTKAEDDYPSALCLFTLFTMILLMGCLCCPYLFFAGWLAKKGRPEWDAVMTTINENILKGKNAFIYEGNRMDILDPNVSNDSSPFYHVSFVKFYLFHNS